MEYDFNSKEVADILGGTLKNASNYKETFVETEEFANLQLVNISPINVTGSAYLYARTLATSSFVLDHPVYGNLDYMSDYDSLTGIQFPLISDTKSSGAFYNITGTPYNITYATSSGITAPVFNRTSSYINYTGFPIIYPPYTINAWVLFTSVIAAQQNIFDFSGSTQTYPRLDLRSNGKFLFYLNNESYRYSSSTMASSDYNTWKMITIVNDGSYLNAGLFLYINGALNNGSAGNDSSIPYDITNELQIGRAGTADYWGGMITEVSIVPRDLDATEVAALYNSGTLVRYPENDYMGIRSSLISAYRLEGNANDSYGTNNGTVSGATLVSSGIVGSCYSFDGNNDYIDLVDTPFRFSSGFTTSAWVKPSVISDSKFISKGNSCFSVGIASNYYRTTIYDTTWKGISSNSVAIANQWAHIVSTWNSQDKTIRMYVNGVLQTATNTANYIRNIASYKLQLGRNPEGTNYWNGLIDEVSVWNRVLTQSEITDIYNQGVPKVYPYSGAYGYNLDGGYLSSSLISSVIL